MSEARASAAARLRWQTVDEEPTLPDLGAEKRATHPEFAGMEFLHVRAQSLLNEVPAAAGLPFRWTANVYRGCSHACSYCLAGDTPVLLADGRTLPISELRPGMDVIGSWIGERYRYYTATPILDHWRTTKRAYRITLVDGTRLVASGDHRFLTERGWKHVTGTGAGRDQRPHLTTNDKLVGTGTFAEPPKPSRTYAQGYLCGMIRGDAHREIGAIRTSKKASVERIQEIIAWPDRPDESWRKGFLAGIFDAEGSCSRGVLRISNGDRAIIDWIRRCLDVLGLKHVLESPRPGMWRVRLLGGLRARHRFFHLTDPVITRKRSIEGAAVKGDAPLQVERIEDIGVEIPMYDITTGTGDFIANGVISHNCFARPSHTWLDLDAGRDFEKVVVVKVNAVERLRAELRRPSWRGEAVALGTNTDPYQRAEGRYRLTRGVVQTLADAGNPFSVLTKGTLVTRDLDILADAAARGVCTGVSMSIPTLDEQVWRTSEPGTPHPRTRMEVIARLAEAGVPTGVMLAPLLPGMSDDDANLDAVVRAAVEAGAGHITPILLHLRPGVREVFLPWLAEVRPDLVAAYERWYPRAYAPTSMRNALARRVARLVERHGPLRTTSTPRLADLGPRRAPATETGPADDGGQLSLL